MRPHGGARVRNGERRARRATRAARSRVSRLATPASTESAAQAALAVASAPKLDEPNADAPITAAAPRPTAPPAIPTSSDSARARRVSTADVGTTGPQERLVAAAPIGTRPRDRAGQQSGQQRPGQAEEEEGHAGVEAVAARGVECGREVVADDGRPRRARLEVLGEAERACVRRRRVAGQGATVEVRVHLSPDERGVRRVRAPPKSARQRAAGTIRTLSGTGACVAAAEAAGGRSNCWGAVKSTMPSMRTCASGMPARPIDTRSPTPTPRFAAICWAIRTPRVRADELAQLTWERRPVAGRACRARVRRRQCSSLRPQMAW